jgi:hypothetical protein
MPVRQPYAGVDFIPRSRISLHKNSKTVKQGLKGQLIHGLINDIYILNLQEDVPSLTHILILLLPRESVHFLLQKAKKTKILYLFSVLFRSRSTESSCARTGLFVGRTYFWFVEIGDP